ncbi:hypothetical protein [Herbaspirillum huttiense]|uniref:hypothetical protein n=1 Tax=Herbaspirillum huttiense TaxID=863372 RepID=UPI002176DABE|nr:hypothetical protein [Herbaspirillum huttiense]UWE17981.1 hypothetical protein NY669_07335 [Herbaspirillum huttiense]
MNRPALLLLLLLTVSFLCACTRTDGTWQATQDVQVFKAADEADEMVFIARQVERCALGREQVVKAFMYREIACQQGQGWIPYQSGYPFVRERQPSPERK